MATKTIPLYGGALSMNVPTSRLDKPTVAFDMLDMSNFREVPDHQEVHSDIDSGCVIIVELLGTAEVSDAECATYYFQDLAKCNECELGTTAILTSTNVIDDGDAPNFPSASSPNASALPCEVSFKCSAEGHQLISKFVNESEYPNEVYVGMAIIRLGEPVSTDLVVSVSVPLKVHPHSSEAKNVTEATIMTLAEAQRVLRVVVESLKVERWSLFV